MTFKKITVAGGGVMGSQIAFQIAFKGFETTIWLRSEGSVERTRQKIDALRKTYLKSLDAMKKDRSIHIPGISDKKELTDREIEELKENVKRAYEGLVFTTSYHEAAKDCDLLIETISEVASDKKAFYIAMAKQLPKKTIIVTNSSTMLPSALAEYTGRPDRYLAMHFANKIWKFNMVEIMGHEKTDPIYIRTIKNFSLEIGMVPFVLKKEQPAYILNTMLMPFLISALMLYIDEVAEIEDIDKCWEKATGSPAGPFKILDTVGIGTAYNIISMHPKVKDPSSEAYKIKGLLGEYMDRGKLGRSSGEGFYKYS